MNKLSIKVFVILVAVSNAFKRLNKSSTILTLILVAAMLYFQMTEWFADDFGIVELNVFK